MVDRTYLLTSKQMARFVSDGFLRFDEMVPDELNTAACSEMDRHMPREKAGAPFNGIWKDSVIGRVFRMPEIQGIIHSLVGPNPLYDHHAVHTVPAGHQTGQIWHADGIIDRRMYGAFDIQFFYFAHDTPREMGGTMILPGSHYRYISETDIARYQNFLGQVPMVCKAGTVVVVHHGIWHCAQPNRTDRVRYMFKLRLNPTVRQLRLWNTDDIDDPEIPGLLSINHKWYGNEDRIEQVNRIRFWRYLTGNERFDNHYWLTRIENEPAMAS